ncbi:hypothetical protein WGP40_02640 [Brachymonas sp. G13]|uniref:hypothetical protein n=1 Tax=Brachymonas wangyanguii TaxID=3130163 RepID=UPI0016B32803|nr:hypothetical protein [Ramlibacter sp.]
MRINAIFGKLSLDFDQLDAARAQSEYIASIRLCHAGIELQVRNMLQLEHSGIKIQALKWPGTGNQGIRHI